MLRRKGKNKKSTPEITAENVLNRDFKATVPFEKWLTDVTEFKYYVGPEVKKLYLSAILDLYDRRIIAYKIGDSNNNELVFTTFDEELLFIRMQNPYSTATEDFSTRIRYSTKSLLMQE